MEGRRREKVRVERVGIAVSVNSEEIQEREIRLAAGTVQPR